MNGVRTKLEEQLGKMNECRITLFIPDELLTASVFVFDRFEAAYAALAEHHVLKVDIEGYGTLTADGFEALCRQKGLAGKHSDWPILVMKLSANNHRP